MIAMTPETPVAVEIAYRDGQTITYVNVSLVEIDTTEQIIVIRHNQRRDERDITRAKRITIHHINTNRERLQSPSKPEEPEEAICWGTERLS